ncbi:unnamed protein product [Bursaphelenchus okinawaensis]|uniref:Peptidase M13 C-terminal domain-containing protein n=1 Tax=Bursaphelenchus okinawaensis TaxID=465554 RepID=A0A811K9A7_9BILA|nr:unnamed protein product [Bursaphelenchus okinawaensis]CAG9095611.1 unnamed protein product [Bursaphelenchus okinawaensis]
MNSLHFLVLLIFSGIDAKSVKRSVDLGVFRSNPCDYDAIHTICDSLPTYKFGEFEVFTHSKTNSKLREHLNAVIKQCNQPATVKLNKEVYNKRILDRYNATVAKAEKEHNLKGHALHLYMRTAAFLKINLGIDYLYRISIENVEELTAKRERIVLRAVAESGCTRPDILKQMGLNEFEIENVLKHDQQMTTALGKVTGLETAVYRQFAPYFEEFGSHLNFAQGHLFDGKFSQILAERTPAYQMMVDLRENYAHWHLECTVIEKTEEAYNKLRNGTVMGGNCNDALQHIMDRVNALELFDTEAKRQKVIKKLSTVFNNVRKAVRERVLHTKMAKPTELKILSLLKAFHVNFLQVSDFDQHKTFVEQITEIDKDIDDHISYKMNTLNLSLAVYDLLNSMHIKDSNAITIQISDLRHWSWAEDLDDASFYGTIGVTVARKVWRKIDEEVGLEWREIVELDEDSELTDYQFDQVALTTSLRALQLNSYQSGVKTLKKGQDFTLDQAFNVAYFIENECDANSSSSVLSDIYANSFNCITDDYFSFTHTKTDLRLGSTFTSLHLRQPQVVKKKFDELGAFSERNLNNSVNPCDDFYQFACGKSTESIYQVTYDKNIKLIEKELQGKIADGEPKAIQFLKRIYQKCVRGELRDLPYTKEELLPVIDRIKEVTNLKQIPVRYGDFDGDEFLQKFGALAGYVHSEFNVGPYKYYTAKRTGVHQHVQARILTLPPADMTPNDRGNLWARFFDVTGHSINNTEIDELVIEGINLRNASFLQDISNLKQFGASNSVNGLLGGIDYNKVGLNLTAFFTTSLGHNLSPEEKVSVDLTVNYSKLTEHELQVAAINGVIEELLLHLFSNDIADNVVCYGVMETAGEFLLGRILLSSRFVFDNITDNDRKEGKILFEEFQQKISRQSEHVYMAMKYLLKETPWLSETTLIRALQRGDNLTMILGNDPLLLDEALIKIYNNTVFDEDHVIKKQYAHNVMPIRRAEFGCCTLSLLPYSPVMSFMIHLLETTSTVVFPANSLFWPMYDHDHPAEYVFGFFGASLSHEIAHMFDGRSLLPKEFPDDPAWMTNDEVRSYAKMAGCLADQYDNLCDSEGVCADGVQSNIEIMADNIGLQLAYRALQSWLEVYGPDPRPDGHLIYRLTTPQLFFLNYVQYMCESRGREGQSEKAFRAHPRVDFRVQGTLMNMPAFSDAYNCPVGSRYWRTEDSGGTCPIFNGALKENKGSRLEEIWEKQGIFHNV